MLADLRVVECGNDPAVMVAGSRLAYLGADVVVTGSEVGSAEGTASDHWTGVPRPIAWNRGKRHLQANDDDEFDSLIVGADVVLTGRTLAADMALADRVAEGALLVESDWERFAGELSVQAATGMLSYLGELDGEPVRIGWEAVTWAQGVLVAQAVLASCVSGQTIRGGRVRLSAVRTAATLISNQIVAHSSPDDWIGFAAYQWQPPEYGFRCSDGWVEIIFFRNDDGWREFCQQVGLAGLGTDDRFATYPARTNHKSELARALEPALALMATQTVEELVGRCGGMVAERSSLLRAAHHPQTTANRLVLDDDPAQLTSPWSICGERSALSTSFPVPEVGWAGPSSWRHKDQSLADPPLRGVTVADVTEGAQGPYAVSLLADLGATVVKLERPGGEFMRHVGPFRQGEALPFLALSHGRRLCWEVDLQSSPGQAAAAILATSCDVFIENWRPGTAERLGLGIVKLHSANDQLVYVSASGFGSAGPLAQKGALDQISQAASGLWSLSGRHGGTPERFRGALLDYLSALVTTEGTLAGLVARARGVSAVTVEVSQLATALSVAQSELSLPPERQQPRGSRSRHYCPSAAFQCSDGHWIAVEVTDDVKWSNLVAELDLADLAGAGYSTNSLRLEREEVVYSHLEQRIANHPSSYWTSPPLDEYCTLVVRPLAEALSDGGVLKGRNHVVIDQSRVGDVLRVRPPWQSPAYPQLTESGPAQGRDTAMMHALLSGGVARTRLEDGSP